MTWLDLAHDDPFGGHNLPYCAFGSDRLGVRVGGFLLDLTAAARHGLVDGPFDRPVLNDFLAAGRPTWTAVRRRVSQLLHDEKQRRRVEPLLRPVDGEELRMPFEVGDYVDFYSSEHHAQNLGALFRPGQPPLTPNWKHLPIGYHGRGGTVVVSGTPIVRPCGQRLVDGSPVFGPSTRLDIEAEVGFVVGGRSALGRPVSTADFLDHVFGVVLVNDWSARDIQAWEYQPLGPFLGKSFATSVSPYVVPLDALSHATVRAPEQDPPVLPYLRDDRVGYDIRLAVSWNGEVVSRPPFAGMYWTPAQQLAHLTANGASVRPGDLFASGTVSGPKRDQTGSLIELTWNERFLADGDTVSITATAPGPAGTTVGFGAVTGTVVAAG